LYSTRGREYTQEILNLIDPTGQYFKGNVVIGEEDEFGVKNGPPVKSLEKVLEIVPRLDKELLLIIDDEA
jgi:hypothetical protein